MTLAEGLALAALIVAMLGPLLAHKNLRGWHVVVLCILGFALVLALVLAPMYLGAGSQAIARPR